VLVFVARLLHLVSLSFLLTPTMPNPDGKNQHGGKGILDSNFYTCTGLLIHFQIASFPEGWPNILHGMHQQGLSNKDIHYEVQKYHGVVIGYVVFSFGILG
jgi:hypothetical protein